MGIGHFFGVRTQAAQFEQPPSNWAHYQWEDGADFATGKG